VWRRVCARLARVAWRGAHARCKAGVTSYSLLLFYSSYSRLATLFSFSSSGRETGAQRRPPHLRARTERAAWPHPNGPAAFIPQKKKTCSGHGCAPCSPGPPARRARRARPGEKSGRRGGCRGKRWWRARMRSVAPLP
jgi:hypothetical protein